MKGTTIAALAALALLAGCGEMTAKVWPFGGETVRERPRGPADATEYRCAAGKRFHVRLLDGGAAAWLILPEREVRLERDAGGTRYAKGGLALRLDGDAATLADGGASVADCRKFVAEAAAGN